MLMFRVFLLVLLFTPLFAQQHPNKQIDILIKNGIEDLLNQKYNSARDNFAKLDKDYPYNPMGKIMQVATEILVNQDIAEPIKTSQVLEKLQKAIDMAESLREKDQTNPWYLYYYSLAQSYLAVAKGATGSWISALSTGYSAKNSFEDLLDMDNRFLESYIALGTWKYWSSEKMEFLTWLPFVKDERNDGIGLLQKALTGNSYHYYFAAHTLARIYIHNKQPDKAIQVITPLMKKYPASRFFMWDEARAYEDLDRKKAILCYQKLLDSYETEKLPNKSRLYLIYYIMAKTHLALGETELAKKMITQIPAFTAMSEVEREELAERKDRITKLKQQLK